MSVLEQGWITFAVDYGVIGLLIFLCFMVVGLALERILFFRKLDVAQYEKKQSLELQIRKNLPFIGTVAGNAPYIGLLGTLLSIMMTFYNIGVDNSLNTTSIMASLALALKATAVGLIVAIVAVVFYNMLSQKSDSLLLQWDMIHEK